MTNWSRLRALLLGVTCGALIGCQGVQPAPSSPANLDSSADSTSATSGNEEALDVRLEAVDESRPEASLQTRNPFRFGSPTSGAFTDLEPAVSTNPTPVPLAAAPGATPFQPRVRIRMIGLVEAAETVGLIAVLTDGNAVFHGRAGDIVEGRYRLESVEPTSVELVSLSDGSRQRIRLSPR